MMTVSVIRSRRRLPEHWNSNSSWRRSAIACAGLHEAASDARKLLVWTTLAADREHSDAEGGDSDLGDLLEVVSAPDFPEGGGAKLENLDAIEHRGCGMLHEGGADHEAAEGGSARLEVDAIEHATMEADRICEASFSL